MTMNGINELVSAAHSASTWADEHERGLFGTVTSQSVSQLITLKTSSFFGRARSTHRSLRPARPLTYEPRREGACPAVTPTLGPDATGSLTCSALPDVVRWLLVAARTKAARQIYQAVQKHKKHAYILTRYAIVAFILKVLPGTGSRLSAGRGTTNTDSRQPRALPSPLHASACKSPRSASGAVRLSRSAPCSDPT
jgi:hypothetical protein